ncbi:MAG: hypothetical protein COA79_22540 [Planctomycetota bacterium]|nr:response regulator [Bacteroidia bacterium]PCJ53792.1 MAG: hypothetical protein COA79_22540 [Planctomycetota bacterium]
MKILIVDDIEDITEVLNLYLCDKHQVVTFNDPLKALGHYRNDPEFDVILVDMLMPNLRGDQLMEKIHEINPSQCFIVISGFFNSEVAEFLTEFSDYVFKLSKPIDFGELDMSLDSIAVD